MGVSLQHKCMPFENGNGSGDSGHCHPSKLFKCFSMLMPCDSRVGVLVRCLACVCICVSVSVCVSASLSVAVSASACVCAAAYSVQLQVAHQHTHTHTWTLT